MQADIALIVVTVILALSVIRPLIGALHSVAAVFAFVLAWFAVGLVQIYFLDLNFPLAESRWRSAGDPASLWAALAAVLLQAGFPAAIILGTRRIHALRKSTRN